MVLIMAEFLIPNVDRNGPCVCSWRRPRYCTQL